MWRLAIYLLRQYLVGAVADLAAGHKGRFAFRAVSLALLSHVAGGAEGGWQVAP